MMWRWVNVHVTCVSERGSGGGNGPSVLHLHVREGACNGCGDEQ
jgi:hypothetical protein